MHLREALPPRVVAVCASRTASTNAFRPIPCFAARNGAPTLLLVRLGDQGKRGGVANRRYREIGIEQRPIEMAGGRPLHRGDLLHRGLLEPREISLGNKQLFITQEQPEAFA